MLAASRLAFLSALMLLTPTRVGADAPLNALTFYEGRTRSEGLLTVMLGKPRHSRSVGTGTIKPDGSLVLVQQIDDEGKAPHERRWEIHRIAPGHYAGTMNEATGPVTIDEVSGRYRLRLKLAGGLHVEQWLMPLPGGKAARSHLVVRKLGIVVATGDGLISKVA